MRLSVVVPFYRNPRMLARQYLTMALEWPADIKAQLEVIVVDDGSPEPAADVPRLYNGSMPPLSIYRVTEDRPWHQHGARNLGAYVATGEWLLLTDADHVIPADTLRDLLRAIDLVEGDVVYMFDRRDAPAGEPWKSDHWSTMATTLNDRGEPKPHVNSFAMPRKLYWEVGGYDEDYCGVYGTDRLFRERLFKCAPHHRLRSPLIRVGREVIPDASTTTLTRKDGRDPHAKKRIAADKRRRGEADVIKTLQFPWERVL